MAGQRWAHTTNGRHLEVDAVLALRQAVRSGNLRTRSIRSISYETKVSERDTADALAGEGWYATYPSEGVIPSDKYPHFYDGSRTFSQAALGVQAERKSSRTNGNGYAPPSGGLTYQTDERYVVESVQKDEPVTPAPAKASARPKARPRGRGAKYPIEKIEAARLYYATRPDLTIPQIERELDLGDGAVNRIRLGVGVPEGYPPLPGRPRHFDKGRRPESVEEYVKMYGPRTDGEAAPVSSTTSEPERPAEATTEAPVTNDEGGAVWYWEPKLAVWLHEQDVPVELRRHLRSQVVPTRPEPPDNTEDPLADFDQAMRNDALEDHRLAEAMEDYPPEDLDTTFSIVSNSTAPSPHGDADPRREMAAEALLRQMVEAVGPRQLGWVKLPGGDLEHLLSRWLHARQELREVEADVEAYLTRLADL